MKKAAAEIDKCYYCGQEYHPMRVYVRASSDPLGEQRRYICDLSILKDDYGNITGVVQKTECHEKGIADGWVYADWLTPKR